MEGDLGFGSDWNFSWHLKVGFSKAAAEIWMKNKLFGGSDNAEWARAGLVEGEGSWNEMIFNKLPTNESGILPEMEF